MAKNNKRGQRTILDRDHLFQATGRGQLAFGGNFVKVERFFDKLFMDLAVRYAAREHSYSSLISRSLLERLEFFSSFPRLATYAAPQSELSRKNHVLSPAVCYHAYGLLKNSVVPEPLCITAIGKCFRYEGNKLMKTPVRLWDFTMREIIFFGNPQEVRTIRDQIMKKTEKIAHSVGIAADIREATDPFFLGSSRGKLLIQKMKKLKFELQARVGSRENMAIASFNNHEDFFTRKMNIRLPNGKFAHSGCVAFGIERWAFAFFQQNGEVGRKWPAFVRRGFSA